MSDRSFFEVFFIGGAGVVIGFTAAALFDKISQHNDEIEELFSRLEECEKNHKYSETLLDKISQRYDEIEELFSRLEECQKNHESSETD